MGYAKEHDGRNEVMSSSKSQKPRRKTGMRRTNGSNVSAYPPLQIYQSTLWIPQQSVGYIPQWISVCTQGLEAQLSFLEREQPWLFARNPYQIAVFEQYHSSCSWQEKLPFPEHRFTIAYAPSAPLVVAKLHLPQIMEPWNPQQAEEEPEIAKPVQFLGLDPMTPREMEVFHCLASGLSNQEIAQHLVIATSTVKWHLKQIYSKLGVSSRTQAIVLAHEYSSLQR